MRGREIKEMNVLTFSQEVCAWLNPLLVVEAGIRYDKEPQSALAPTLLACCSTILRSAKEGSLYDLVSEFLENFRIPPNLLGVLQAMETDKLSENAWNWLRDLKFEGNIELVGKKNSQYPEGTIFLLHERDAVANLMLNPIRLLLNLVGHIANDWKKLAEELKDKKMLFLQHSAPGPFGVYIESRVAQSYVSGDVARVSVQDPDVSVNLRYRAVTVIGMPPIDKKVLNVAKQSAQFNASQTQEPI